MQVAKKIFNVQRQILSNLTYYFKTLRWKSLTNIYLRKLNLSSEDEDKCVITPNKNALYRAFKVFSRYT